MSLVVMLVCTMAGFFLGGLAGALFLTGFFPAAWGGAVIGFAISLIAMVGGSGTFICIDVPDWID